MNKKTLFYIGLALLSLISLLLINPNHDVQADHVPGHHADQSVKKLNDLMVELYGLSKDANKIAVYNQLQPIKLHIKANYAILNSQFEHFHLFEEELNVLERELINKQNIVQWKETVNRLFLASDAMLQGDEGPWREYEVLLLERISLMENTFISPTSYRASTMQANLTLLEHQLNRITLATQLVGNKTRLEELQFRVVDLQAFMLTLPSDSEQQQYYKELEHSIAGIKQTTLALFENTSPVSFEPIIENQHFPLQLACLLTLLISIVLSLTSYRKYKQSPYGVKKL